MHQRFLEWGARVNLPYKILATTPIILGVSVLLSGTAIVDTTVTWMVLSFQPIISIFTRDTYGLWLIVDGIILLFRRENRRELILLYLPVWLLVVGVVGFIFATHRASTVAALVVCFSVYVLCSIRWGMKAL